MLKYFYLAALMLLSNAAIADVPMILITDGTKKDAEKVIGIAASSISESTDPEAARKAVFEQEGGQEKAEAFYKHVSDMVRRQKPATDLELKYKPYFDHIDEQFKLAHRHKFHSNRIRNEELRKQYLQQLREERTKYAKMQHEEYKAQINALFKETDRILHDKSFVEFMRPTVPNIDELHRSFVIYTCSEFVGRLEIKPNVGVYINEMERSAYEVFGFNEIEKYLLASSNKDRAFQYSSLVMQNEIIPSMPTYLFWHKLRNHRNLVRAYVRFQDDESVKRYVDANCRPYAKFVRQENTYKPRPR